MVEGVKRSREEKSEGQKEKHQMGLKPEATG